MVYRPPPAQAQAQPAQAQAQPPPPERPPLEREGGGGGLVTLVTPLVKSLTLPSTLPENVCTPPTTEAAKSAPGRETFPLEPPEDEPKDEAGADVCGMDDWR